MDQLPLPLILEILTRLNSSFDLARCRLASKTLNAIARDVRCINLHCTFDRYAKPRLAETGTLTTPFKVILKDLVLNVRDLESLSVGVEKALPGTEYDDELDESDDLYLTDVHFVSEWLPRVAERLRSLSISDFWFQSCWRRSDVLSLISACCNSLVELEIKNAWLSVDDMKMMPSLTSLTLEFIRLDDEDLNKLNESFPSLQILNLIGAGGFRNPKIHLLHLKTCKWTISNAPNSLSIQAPNLVKLWLDCVRPQSLILKTPLLSEFYLSLDHASKFEAEFPNLRTLLLRSRSLCRLAQECSFGQTVNKLLIDSPCLSKLDKIPQLSLEALLDAFPNVVSITIYHGVWSGLEAFHGGGLEGGCGLNRLKEITVYLVVDDLEATIGSVFSVVDKCSSLMDMKLLIHCDADLIAARRLVSRCAAGCPRVRWRWGMWKKGEEVVGCLAEPSFPPWLGESIVVGAI